MPRHSTVLARVAVREDVTGWRFRGRMRVTGALGLSWGPGPGHSRVRLRDGGVSAARPLTGQLASLRTNVRRRPGGEAAWLFLT